jgi:hypothetical protein
MVKAVKGDPSAKSQGTSVDASVGKVAPKKEAPKQTPDFVEAIKKGFKAPWKHKSLWFYGVLLTLFAGGGSSFSNSNSFPQNSPSDMGKVTDFIKSVPVSVWLIIGAISAFLIIVFTILGLIVGSWSLAAIINGNVKIDKGEDITRKEIGKTGKAPVWGLIKLNFFLPVAITLVIAAVASIFVVLAVIMGQPAGMIFGVIVGLLALLALIPFLVYFGIVWVMAARFVVVEGQKTFESISSARKLLKGNFWMTFLLSLVAGFISGCGGCLGSIVFIIFLIATIGFAIGKMFIVAAVMGVFALAGLVILLIVSGYFTAFTESTLTIWWLDLKKLK